MATVRDVVAYICQRYPYAGELSKARLTKLVYLSDWKMCIQTDHQITPIRWYFNHFGPYVDDVEQLARNDRAFAIDRTNNFYGGLKEIIRLVGEIHPDLTVQERLAIDFSIENTQNLSWDAFIKLVYSTYPVLTESRFDYLDLPTLSRQYKSTLAYSG